MIEATERDRDLVQGHRDVVDGLAETNRDFLSVKYRGSRDAARGRRLHLITSSVCRSQGIGWIDRLLRHKRGSAAVRKGCCDGVYGRRRSNPSQYGSSRGHRHADLDEVADVGGEQCTD